MKLIFIIDSKDELTGPRELELIKKSKDACFLFIKKNEHIRALALSLKQSSIIDISDDYNELLVRSRKNIIDFFCELPRRGFKINGNKTVDFHNIFDAKGFSAWWMTNFADKAPESGGVVNRLFQLDIIRVILEKNNFDLGLIHTCDRRFGASVDSLFSAHKLSRCSPATDAVGEYAVMDHRCASRDLLILFMNAFRLIVSKYISAVFFNFFKPEKTKESGAPNICFHSWYPAHWHNYDGIFQDKYYFDAVDYVKSNSAAVKPGYLFKLKWYDKSVLSLFKSLKRLSGLNCEYDFLDRHISVRDVISSYYEAFMLRKTLDSSFALDRNKEIFKYNGIDVFALAYFELSGSFLNDMPYNRILAKALARYLKKNNDIKAFVNFLELYAYARGFINEVKSDPALNGLKMIAFQHSTINKYNLHYNFSETELNAGHETERSRLPQPDLFILSGKKAYETLNSYNIDPRKLIVTGTPRYDFILNYLNRPRKRDLFRNGHSRILIAAAGEYNETIDMVNLCLEPLCGYDDIFLTIKMHPICDISGELSQMLNSRPEYKKLKYEIKKDNIYDLIIENDILITSNSMVGLEALVLGSGVVLYGNPFKINLSPLADSLEFRDRICYSNKKFKETIDKAVAGKLEKPSPEVINKLVEDHYHKLDGRANERILKVLEGMIDDGN